MGAGPDEPLGLGGRLPCLERDLEIGSAGNLFAIPSVH